MTPQEMKKIQDGFLEQAKFLCRKHGDASPMSFIFSRKGNLDGIENMGLAVRFLKPKDMGFFEQLRDHDVVVGVRTWNMSWKERFNVIYHTQDAEARAIIDTAIATITPELPKSNNDDDWKVIARPMMNVLNIDEKDVTSRAVRDICRKVRAFAVISVHGAYMLSGGEATRSNYDDMIKKYGSLEACPEAGEILQCMLESTALTRTLMIPVYRRGNVKGEGVVKGFGKVTEYSSDINPQLQAEGRFATLLEPLPTSTVKA